MTQDHVCIFVEDRLRCSTCGAHRVSLERRAVANGDLVIDPQGRWIEYGGTRYVPEWS